MGNCPFHGVRKGIGYISDVFSRELLQKPKERDIRESNGAYNELGDIISEIFPESFFEKEVGEEEFFGVYPLYAKSIFQRLGEEQIQNFFSREKVRGIEFPKMEGMKLYPTRVEEAIEQGWGHACYMIAVFLNETLREKRSDSEYEDFLQEAQKILIVLGKQHLNIETGFVLNIDKILTGRFYSDTIYDSIDKIGSTHLPALGCPALFFGDKRVARSLFYWMGEHMLRVYKNKTSSRLLGESVVLGFQRVLNKMRVTEL